LPGNIPFKRTVTREFGLAGVLLRRRKVVRVWCVVPRGRNMKLDLGKVEFIDIPWRQERSEFIKISLLEDFALSEFWRRVEVRFDPLLDFFASR
jgi:hypothetical protein